MKRGTYRLTVVNLAIMTLLWAQFRPARAQQTQQQNVAPMQRGHALEIVDSLGRVRASITVQPPVKVDSKKYPQTVLLCIRPLITGHICENS